MSDTREKFKPNANPDVTNQR